MKKLFISCPMRGRTEEAIRTTMEQMHRIAEAVFNEELKVVPTYIEDEPPQDIHAAIWFLGESVKKMAEADYFIGVYDPDKEYKGCVNENRIAMDYDIPSYIINLDRVAPDVIERRNKLKSSYYKGGYTLL